MDNTRPIVYFKGQKPLEPLVLEAVYERQNIFGKNVIGQHKTRPWYKILLNSVFDPFNVLLIGIAILSLKLDEMETFVIISIMVTISGGIRFYQENKNEIKLSALSKMIKKNITVIRRKREGEEYEEVIDLRDCVPGDFVKLKAGDLVPAEVQLIKSNNLTVDQSALTGESIACMKYVTEQNVIQINYDIDAVAVLNIKKRKSFLAWFKDRFFLFLSNNLGIEMNEKNRNYIEFDSSVLVQFDRNDLVFMGTNVISGSAIGVVLATGKKTFFGVMSEKINFNKPMTAFQRRIKKVSMMLIVLMFIIMIPIILFKGFDILKQQEEEDKKRKGRWILALQFALTIAVGLTPEMLPMNLNTNLAKGTISLSNKNCIVKRIESIINLGSMDILCTDKTGTLTEDFAKLINVFDFKGNNVSIGLELAYLNSAFQSAYRNLTDLAIIDAYKKYESNESEFIKINELPFDFARRKMSVIYEIDKHDIRLITTKGAVKEMLDVCSYCMDQEHVTNNNNILTLDQLFRILSSTNNRYEGEETQSDKKKKNSEFNYAIKKLTKDMKDKLKRFNNNLNECGNRVLAIAYQVESMNIARSKSKLVERDLIFVGFLVLINPPKSSVKKSVQALHSNNVKIKVITGDVISVCKNICRQIGISTSNVLSSEEMNNLTKLELEEVIERTVIFSQMTPIQKWEIIKILKSQGHVVGFLGDGINDALALKEADIGISVDTATEIAKEAADVILLEKNLNCINEGIVSGRKSYINIVKYVSMVVSSNFGNVLSVFISCLWLPFLPMASIHLLIQNLLYDLSQTVMPWDNVDKEDIRKPQEFKLRNLIIFMLFWGPISSIFDVITFAYFYFYKNIRTGSNSDENVLIFQTGWYTVGVLTQTLIVHIIRTPKTPILKSNASASVYISTSICLYMGLITPYVGLNDLFKMRPLDLDFYYFLTAILIAYCLTVQLSKKLYISIFESWFVNVE